MMNSEVPMQKAETASEMSGMRIPILCGVSDRRKPHVYISPQVMGKAPGWRSLPIWHTVASAD